MQQGYLQSNILCKTVLSIAHKTPLKPTLVDQPSASPTTAMCKCVSKLLLNVSGDTIYFDNSQKAVMYFKFHANLFPTLPAIKENSSSSLPALPSTVKAERANRTTWNPRLSESEEILAVIVRFCIWVPTLWSWDQLLNLSKIQFPHL